MAKADTRATQEVFNFLQKHLRFSLERFKFNSLHCHYHCDYSNQTFMDNIVEKIMPAVITTAAIVVKKVNRRNKNSYLSSPDKAFPVGFQHSPTGVAKPARDRQPRTDL